MTAGDEHDGLHDFYVSHTVCNALMPRFMVHLGAFLA